ncbi:MAG: radical SAM protein, partial [Acidobacteria bacterium]|nr:radical SAM protein [Acidobacteriota bacterium]
MNIHDNSQSGAFKPRKTFLALLPYWDPLIPPSGIATLKGYLQQFGYEVKTDDLIVKKEFQDLYNLYFVKMEEFVAIDNRGNFYNMGHNILQNHMMAHINYKNEEDYKKLVKIMIFEEFRTHVTESQVNELVKIIAGIYTGLEKYFLRVLESEKPDVLGLSAYKGTLPACLFVFRLAKKHFPHIMTVMGGSVFSTTVTTDSPNFEILMEETKPYIDKIIIGEGEILFLKLLRGELPEGQRIFPLQSMNMKGLDLSEAALPDYGDFDIRLYPYMAATGSSSCPYMCSFCNTARYWGPYRKKNIQQLLDEMTQLYQKYGNQVFYMSDALINPIITDMANECIRRDISLYYDCFHRVDNAGCSIENTLLWRRGGLYRVRLGVESGSQKVLDLIGKKITVDQTKAVLSALAFAGIKTTTYWVIGHPGETEEDFQKTLQLLEETKNDIFQAEPTPLEYVFSGQSHSEAWEGKRKLLYPEKYARDMLLSYTYVIDADPTWEVTLDRIYRFDKLRRKLGIPNPYSLPEHFEADERWQRLHENSVPPLLSF